LLSTCNRNIAVPQNHHETKGGEEKKKKKYTRLSPLYTATAGKIAIRMIRAAAACN
jgi:hypothetical protein